MSAPIAGRAAVTALADLSALPEAEQLALLPTRQNAVPTEADRMRSSVAARRRGRPEGAQNLATREMLQFVRRVLGDPLLERARDAMHTPESLAVELGCTKLEAFDRLDKIRADLARYFYAPLAAVDDQGNAVVPVFQMAIGGHVLGADGRKPWEYENEENQSLSEAAPRVSHGAVSHEEPK